MNELQFRSTKIQRSCLRARIGDSLAGDGYRISHIRMREPVVGGEDTWVRNYLWPFPQDGLSRLEVEEELARYERKAILRYQRKKQRHAEQQARRLRRRADHQDPARHAKVTTEPHPSGGTMNRLV